MCHTVTKCSHYETPEGRYHFLNSWCIGKDLSEYKTALYLKFSALFRIIHAVHYIGHREPLSTEIERLISFRKKKKKKRTFTVSNGTVSVETGMISQTKVFRDVQLVKGPV